MSTTGRCADLSELAGESLGATATTAENWLLVDVAGTWPRDVSSGDGLPEPARRTVRTWLESTPSSRLLFVRGPGRPRANTRLAFVVHAGDARTEVRRIELRTLAALSEVDLADAGEVVDADLVLVCGHGARDACCAVRGTAVFGSLAAQLDGDRLWISSHHGGHRFAANVLVLPHGVHLGRVTPDAAARVVGEALRGRIDLAQYRGRVAYPARVQAAERAVRIAMGIDDLAGLRLVAVDGERVRFRGPHGEEYVALVEESVGPSLPASCGARAEPQAALSARLV